MKIFSKPGLLLSLIVFFYCINACLCIPAQSTTSDETAFFDYAKRYVSGNPDRINPRADNSKMPVIVLNVLPRIIEQIIHPGLKKQDLGRSDIVHGRYISVLFSLLVILLVYQWAKEWYGEAAGLFAALLISLSPNNLAAAVLVTTDGYSVLFLLAVFYFLWKFIATGSGKHFLLFSICVALAQLVKQSLFHLYLLIPVCLLIYYLAKRPMINWKTCIKFIAVFLCIQWLLINAGYYFHGTNRALEHYSFMSHSFQRMQNHFPGWMPIPFPRPFVEGLDMAKYYDQIGGGYPGISSFGKVTILGEHATGGHFWYYYFVSIWYKTPISYLILLLAAGIYYLKGSDWKAFVAKEFFVLAPVIYFLLFMSFFYNTQCGIRHIVFLYPLLIILCASVIPRLKKIWEKIVTGAIVAWLFLSVIVYWKNYYPYTNEFILNKTNAYQYVGSNNLEFNQAYLFCLDYLKQHPAVNWAPEQPASGDFLISTEQYLDVWNTHKYAWISGIKPSGLVAYSTLLIHVPK